ncbi:MAG TPA: complex I NDUFA9 subunit family protein [Candidatus Thermoplasmatota archaeon]|nr:complex I NDUFA9 subunit family protein [Candidatus Thermoplasmatota archaeon]
MAIAITGAAGFVGRHLVWHLLEKGEAVRGLVHDPADGQTLEALGAGWKQGDVRKPETLRDFVRGADAVVNLVAILREAPAEGQTFSAVNVEGARNVARTCAQEGVPRLVHVSALGVVANPAFPYADSKWRGEDAVRKEFPAATILRPSLLAGRGHPAFDVWARQVRSLPLVPVPGDGNVKLQPLDVRDLSECVRLAATQPDYARRSIDLGGPEQLTYDQILDAVMRRLRRKRAKFHLPHSLANFGAGAMALLQRKPDVTSGEIDELLRADHVTSTISVEKHFGFAPRTLDQALEAMF